MLTERNDVCGPLADGEWPEDIADLRHGFAGKLNVYRVMARHPDLLRAWAPLRQHVVLSSALGQDLSEIVILRTAVRLGSSYEWSHHVSRARKIGMSDERIAAIRGLPEGRDGLIVRAVDSLLDQQRLSPELESELAESIGRKGVFDLLATVGFYSVLGYLVQTYDTPIDDDVAKELSEAPLR